MTKSINVIPVKEVKIKMEWIKKNKLILEKKELYDEVDIEIEKGKDNIQIDKRIIKVIQHKFKNESYELFRLEFSKFINLNKFSYIQNILEQSNQTNQPDSIINFLFI